jgi:hypothetical protein
MATYENNTLMTVKDAAGNKYLLYPVTKLECVEGMPDLAAGADGQALAKVGGVLSWKSFTAEEVLGARNLELLDEPGVEGSDGLRFKYVRDSRTEDGHVLDIRSIGNDEATIIRGVADPLDDHDATNVWYVNKKISENKALVFPNKTVPVASWVSNTTYSALGYNWRASVPCTGVTASHRPDVALGAADAESGNFATVCESYDGGVYIYCKTKPTATVTIPSIVCVKGA